MAWAIYLLVFCQGIDKHAKGDKVPRQYFMQEISLHGTPGLDAWCSKYIIFRVRTTT